MELFNKDNPAFKKDLDAFVKKHNKTEITRKELHDILDKKLDDAIEEYLEKYGKAEYIPLDSTNGRFYTERHYIEGEEEKAKDDVFGLMSDHLGNFIV